MVFADKLKWLGRKYSQEEYEAARLAEIMERSEMRLKTSIDEEYAVFREKCLKAVQQGEWRCSMQIERDRYGTARRTNELIMDKSVSEEVRKSYIGILGVMRNHFTATEVSIIRKELEVRLRDDGFIGGTVAVNEDLEQEYGDWRYCVEVSATWWGLI